jgi:NitT/TauT family transport system permease protein
MYRTTHSLKWEHVIEIRRFLVSPNNLIFGLFARPEGKWKWILGSIPFVLMIAMYLFFSGERLAINPQDKLLPSFSQMGEAIWKYAFVLDKRTGVYLLWYDTFWSLTRLLSGIVLAATLGFLIGLNTALFPGMRAVFQPFLTVVSIIPPLTLLPILFISFGVGEEVKMILIFIGTVFVISRDILLATGDIPKEQIVKSLSLGATQLGVVYRMILPQVLPRLLNTVRLSLGAAWLFLIAAEAVASTEGLGYRIFLVRRFMAMDIILPYVAWITFLGFMMDYGLRLVVRYGFPWYTDK